MEGSTSPVIAPEPSGYRVGDLVIDVGRQRVTRAEVEIPLSQLSFDLLLVLARAAPNLQSFDQLMERVWPGLVVTPETVSQRIKLVRDALGDDSHAPRYIAGVRGRGYRMVASVSSLSAATIPGSSATTQTGPPAESARGAALPTLTGHGVSRPWLIAAMATALLVVAVWGLAQYIHTRRAWTPATTAAASVVVVQPPKSIAVLPLLDISPSGGNEYLGDGLAQELSGRLSRIPGLRVAARTSAFAFKGRREDVRTIAQTLGVRHVLEGSVRREGDHLRVTAQLIDASSGYQVWSQNYDRSWQDLLAIEDDLARSIIGTLQVVLSSDLAGRIAQAPTEHLAAFDFYLAGLAKLRQPTTAAQLGEAEGLFREALAVDPRFALAYAGLCECDSIGYERSQDSALAARAEAACHQALALDASLREAKLGLAHLYAVTGRNDQASAIFHAAVREDPSDVDAYIGLAGAYEELQRSAEAEGTYRRAIDVDPGYWAAHTAFGNFLFHHGRATLAAQQYQRVTQLVPVSAPAFNNLGAALEMSGDFEGAARAFDKSLELEPTRSGYSNSGTVYYFLGRFTDAARMFRKAAELASEDHRVWGNLADALYQVTATRPQAEHEYQRAIGLAERRLGVNPKDAVTWIQLAFYNARVGEPSRARRCMARALELGSDDVFVHYYAALIALEGGDTAAALVALRRAIALGYPAQLVRAAPDFAGLRDNEGFQHLLAAHGP
ncbi:MAG: tetratricopeptide repeat protein [Gammaproteobacteria bacterium]|nr:MAG: tetratricopeptide repeat protein [Gammaproteobacteria bacterium]